MVSAWKSFHNEMIDNLKLKYPQPLGIPSALDRKTVNEESVGRDAEFLKAGPITESSNNSFHS